MRAGSNAAETAKALKGGDGLRIRDDLPRLIAQGHEALTTAEKDLLKWVGVFFRKPTPGKFMMRVRMPNGFTNSRQLRAISDLSQRLGNSVLDITTRQQIQLRGFTLAGVPEIWEKLRGVDLHSLQTGMDNVRNLNGCPLAGLTINELVDASLVVLELDQIIVGVDGNPEFTNLPRKFNVTITGCLENCTHCESQDVALVPALRRDRPGFNVLVGGKMGSGGFTIASPLDVFVSIPQAARLVAELIRIFRDEGPRDARSKCRLAFLIEEWGVPRLREELSRRLECGLAPAGRDVRASHGSDHLGVAFQKQPGHQSVGLCVPEGRIAPDQLDELACLAEAYGDGQVRISTGQNIDTKRHAAVLATALEKQLGTDRPALTMHWSGCPAGCGNHEAADIGFRGLKTRVGGKMVEAVEIYVGGRTGPHSSAGQRLVEVAPCDETLPGVVAKMIQSLDPVAPEAAPLEPGTLTEREEDKQFAFRNSTMPGLATRSGDEPSDHPAD